MTTSSTTTTTACPGCFIENACYEVEQINPGNICRICNPSISTTDWSDNDGVDCEENGLCIGGECLEEYPCSSSLLQNTITVQDPVEDMTIIGEYADLDHFDIVEAKVSQLGNEYFMLTIKVNGEIPLKPYGDPFFVFPNENGHHSEITFQWWIDADQNPNTGYFERSGFANEIHIVTKYYRDQTNFRDWWSFIEYFKEPEDSPSRHNSYFTKLLPTVVMGDSVHCLVPKEYLLRGTSDDFNVIAHTKSRFDKLTGEVTFSEDTAPSTDYLTYSPEPVSETPQFRLVNTSNPNPEFNSNFFPMTTAKEMDIQQMAVIAENDSWGKSIFVDSNVIHLFTWHQHNIDVDNALNTVNFNEDWLQETYTHMGAFLEGCDVIAPLLIMQGDLYQGDLGDIVVPATHPLRPLSQGCPMLGDEFMATYDVNLIFDYGIELLLEAFNESYCYGDDRPVFIRAGDGGGAPGNPLLMGYGALYNCHVGGTGSPDWPPIFHEFGHNFALAPGAEDFLLYFPELSEPWATWWSIYIAGVILHDHPDEFPINEHHARLGWTAIRDWQINDMWGPTLEDFQTAVALSQAEFYGDNGILSGTWGPVFDAIHDHLGMNYGYDTHYKFARMLINMKNGEGFFYYYYYDNGNRPVDFKWNLYAAMLSAAAGEDLYDFFLSCAFPLDAQHYNDLLAIVQPLVP